MKNGIFLSVLSGWQEAGLRNRDFFSSPTAPDQPGPNVGLIASVCQIDRAEPTVLEMPRGTSVGTCEPSVNRAASLHMNWFYRGGEEAIIYLSRHIRTRTSRPFLSE